MQYGFTGELSSEYRHRDIDNPVEASLVVLPRGRQSAVYRWTDDGVEELCVLGASCDATTCLNAAEQLVAAIVKDGRKVKTWSFDAEGNRRALEDRPVPEGGKAHDVTLRGRALCAGGHNENDDADILWGSYLGELEGADEISEADAHWRQLPIPEHVLRKRKSIDAIFADERRNPLGRVGRLVAVDNISLPKWTLTYNFPDDEFREESATLRDVHKLPTHTTYESIYAAAANKKWIALASSGVNHGVQSVFISLLDRRTLSEEVVFGGSSERGTDYDGPEAIGLTDDRLLLAGGERGVGHLDLDEFMASEWDRTIGSRPTGASLDRFSYIDMPHDQPVVDIETIPDHSGCFAIFEDGHLSRDWIWIDDSAF